MMKEKKKLLIRCWADQILRQKGASSRPVAVSSCLIQVTGAGAEYFL